ncbi:LCP family protein required for cell wall assembly [Saccharothrix coeruleofusca]|uniref:LCP family protein n=1 Tax=Saccharothrix coeruleofusca TaxID=33919 RepID=UPI0027DB011C|nr:LCP family protein [Saccharothrix coeruleofusca]MBP2334030.1 LCP family protein required for cell wall assembly [Saccharothrix coeruleofusca]
MPPGIPRRADRAPDRAPDLRARPAEQPTERAVRPADAGRGESGDRGSRPVDPDRRARAAELAERRARAAEQAERRSADAPGRARPGDSDDARRPRRPAAERSGERPRPSAARPARRPARRPAPRRHPRAGTARAGIAAGRVVVAFLSVVVLLGTGYAWANFQSLNDNLTTTDVIGAGGGGERPADGSIDILMVGMDSRTDAKGNPLPAEILRELQAGDEKAGGLNTDTLILMHIPNDSGKAVAVSFPRDSYVKIAGNYGRHKINSAYGYGKTAALEKLKAEGLTDQAQLEQQSKQAGAKTLIETIQNLSDVTIDHYAEINLVGFYEITKAVGGVDVCLTQATKDNFSGANFKAGPQTVQGRDALAFVRQRHGLLRGDLDRVVRQQVFMAGLAKKILSAGTLSDPRKLNALIDALTKSIVLDPGWNVLEFAAQMKDMTGGNLEFKTIPTGNPELETPEDGQAVEVVEGEVRRFFDQLGKDPNASTAPDSGVDPATVTVQVLNGSGSTGLAGRVLAALVAEKFADGGSGNATEDVAASVVRYGQGGEAGAKAVAEALDGLPTEQDGTVAAGSVRVLLGPDYDGPGAQNLKGSPLVGLDGARRQPPSSGTAEQPITADGVRCVN